MWSTIPIRDRNCSMNFVRTHACCVQTREITSRFLRAKSRKTASICARKTARTAVSLPALAWQNLFAPSGRKAAGASKALPRRTSRVFEYFSPNRMYANSRNSTRNRAISRVPVRRYAISWVHARFAFSHTISRKCNQQFRSGLHIVRHPLSHEYHTTLKLESRKSKERLFILRKLTCASILCA